MNILEVYIKKNTYVWMVNTAQYGRVPQNISCSNSKSEFWDESFFA